MLSLFTATLVAIPSSKRARSVSRPEARNVSLICSSLKPASWSASSVYWGGAAVSHKGRNYQAKWWTQNEAPPGTTGVWQDKGECSGGSTTPVTPQPAPSTPTAPAPTTGAPSSSCDRPAWVAGRAYVTGDVVRYTDGRLYVAEHDNPGYDPTISTWFWSPYSGSCGSGGSSGSSGSGGCNYPAWQQGAEYHTGDVVMYKATAYVARMRRTRRPSVLIGGGGPIDGAAGSGRGPTRP